MRKLLLEILPDFLHKKNVNKFVQDDDFKYSSGFKGEIGNPVFLAQLKNGKTWTDLITFHPLEYGSVYKYVGDPYSTLSNFCYKNSDRKIPIFEKYKI